MPPAILAGVASYALGSSFTTALLVAGSVYLQNRLRPRVSTPDAPRSTQTVRAAITSAKWRIGRTRVFGTLSQIAWRGSALQMCLILGEAPIHGVARVWVKGRAINVNVVDRGSVNLHADAVLGDSHSKVVGRLDFFLTGESVTGAGIGNAPWDKAAGLRWDNANFHMRGLAFVMVYLWENKEKSRWRSIPEFEFLTTGYKWVPPGTVDDMGDAVAPTVITNAAEVRRWWEVEREGESVDRIDETMYAAAVQTCTDQSYTVNGTIEADDPLDGTRSALDLAWDGTVVDWNGLIRFLPGASRSVSLTIPADDLLDLPTIQPAPDLHSRVNRMVVRAAQSAQADWNPYSLPPLDYSFARNRDGGVLSRELGTVEYITDVGVLAKIAVRQMRDEAGLAAQIRVPYGTEDDPFLYLALAPGQTVRVDVPTLRGRKMQVVSTAPGDESSLILTLAEELFDRYTASGPMIPGVAATVPSGLPAEDIAAPGGLALAFVGTQVTVSWTADTSEDFVAWSLSITEKIGVAAAVTIVDVFLGTAESNYRLTVMPGAVYTVSLAQVLFDRSLSTPATTMGTAPSS